MKDAVVQGIEELREAFPSVIVEETGDGGAYVTIPDFDYGEGWQPQIGWLGTTVSYMYPTTEVYPFFASPKFGRAHGPLNLKGITSGSWRGRSTTQLSIKQSGGWDHNLHTLLMAILSVQNYLRRHP
ncbi:MAG: hypothetical protein ACYC64_00025 [Armatimonadota bacterium]